MRRNLACLLAILLAPAAVGGAPAAAGAAEDADSLEQRRQRMEQMSLQDLAELRRKKERFDRLSPAEQERLRKLHSDLAADPRTDQLRLVLVSYNAWLQTLTAAERAELMSLPPEQRVKQIRQLQQDQHRDEADRLGNPSVTIPIEDAKVVLEWMEDYLNRSRAHLEQQIPRLNERLAQVQDPKRQTAVLMFALAQTRTEAGLTPPPLEPSDFEKLTTRLTESNRKQLVAAPTAKDKSDLILKWCRAAFFRQFEPTREELERYYRESLTAEDREWLDAMPRQRFQQTLRSMYYRDRQVAEWGRGFPGGRGRPGVPNDGSIKRPLEGKLPGVLPFPPGGPFGPGARLPGARPPADPPEVEKPSTKPK